VTPKLQAEIKTKAAFHSPEHEAYLNLQRTADHLLRGVEELMKPMGLTPSQYNVLRILRGAGSEGLACGEIAARMLTRDPDMTRLLDRLDKRGLVSRTRRRNDRRVVMTRITSGGLKLLAALDEPLEELHKKQLQHLGRERLKQLSALLEGARESRE
jgi:DNA-binding MarR family transcriptional regulator